MGEAVSGTTKVSGTRKIWYQNAWHTSKVTGTSFWYQKLGHKTWVVCHAPYTHIIHSRPWWNVNVWHYAATSKTKHFYSDSYQLVLLRYVGDFTFDLTFAEPICW